MPLNDNKPRSCSTSFPYSAPPVEETLTIEEQSAVEEEMQLSLFTLQDGPTISQEEQEVLSAITKLNMLGTTPMQAMTLLYELQQKLLASK